MLGNARHVCVVDDDASLRRSLRNLLSSVGFAVEVFDSAEAFLEAERHKTASCLVLDLRMPGMGGLELLGRLAALGAPNFPPTIVLTGHGDDDARQRSLQAGAFAFVEKPFRAEVLLDAVDRATGQGVAGVASDAGAVSRTSDPQPSEHQMKGSTDPRRALPSVSKHGHICAFFNGPEEERRVLRSFVRDGFMGGEKTFHIIDPEQVADHLQWLRDVGINVESAMSSGQLDVRPWGQVYLRQDRFEQDAMLTLVDDVLRENEAAGYPRTRILAHMEWALTDKPGVDDLIEYEARVNHVLSKRPAPVVCAYDLSKFSASVVMDALRTHPMVIVGGLLLDNPFFVPPETLLLEIKSRQSARKNASVVN